MFDSAPNPSTSTVDFAEPRIPSRSIPAQRSPVEPATRTVVVADPLGMIGDVLVPVLHRHIDGDVILVRTVEEIHSLIRRGTRGEVALVSTGFGDRTAEVIRALNAAGWGRVLTVTSTALADRVLTDVMNAGAQGVIRVPCDESGLQPIDDPLSSREVQVVRLVAEGYSNRMIGQELGLSPLTIKNHLARIGRKLGAGDRARIVALAFRFGLIN